MPKLVVKEFIEKDLRDDLVLVAVVAEAIRLASCLEVVDQLHGFCFDALVHFWTPKRPYRWHGIGRDIVC